MRNYQPHNSIENLVKHLEHFGGIFQEKQLPSVRILSYPVSFIILVEQHWIAVFITEKTIEIIDSNGFLGLKSMSKNLRTFLMVHIRGKHFESTPKLQMDDSDTCGLFAVSFLYYRSKVNLTICNFCDYFSSDLRKNTSLISAIFCTIVENLTDNQN